MILPNLTILLKMRLLDLKKNKFRIPRSKSEIIKIIRDRRKLNQMIKLKKIEIFKSNFLKY